MFKIKNKVLNLGIVHLEVLGNETAFNHENSRESFASLRQNFLDFPTF